MDFLATSYDIFTKMLPALIAVGLLVRDVMRTRSLNNKDYTAAGVSVSREGRKLAAAWKGSHDAVRLEFKEYKGEAERRFNKLEAQISKLQENERVYIATINDLRKYNQSLRKAVA